MSSLNYYKTYKSESTWGTSEGGTAKLSQNQYWNEECHIMYLRLSCWLRELCIPLPSVIEVQAKVNAYISNADKLKASMSVVETNAADVIIKI